MSHDQKRASDWTPQDPVAEQLSAREFTRPSFSERLKGVPCETSQMKHQWHEWHITQGIYNSLLHVMITNACFQKSLTSGEKLLWIISEVFCSPLKPLNSK